MFLKTTQKFFAIKNKYSIVDDKDREVFFAESFFKIRQNCSLFSVSGSLLYTLEAKIFSLFGKYYIKDTNNNEIGALVGHFHLPFVQKWTLLIDGKKYRLRSGGYHTKIYLLDENGRYDKKADRVGLIVKRISKIRDTFEIEFDENRLDINLAVICVIWMDCRFHSGQH